MKMVNKIFSAAVAGMLALSLFSCDAINDADDLLAESGTTNAMYIDGIYLSGLDKIADNTVVTVKVAGRKANQTYKDDKIVAADTKGATTGENWTLDASGIAYTTLGTFKLGDVSKVNGDLKEYKSGFGYVKFAVPVKVESDSTVSSRTVRVEVSFTSGGNECTVQPDKSTSYFTVDMATSPYKTVDAKLEHRFLVLSTNTTNVSVYDTNKAMVLGSASFSAPKKAKNKVDYAKDSDGKYEYEIAEPYCDKHPTHIRSNYGDFELSLSGTDNKNGTNTMTATIAKDIVENWGREHKKLEFGITLNDDWNTKWVGATAITNGDEFYAVQANGDNNKTDFDVTDSARGAVLKEIKITVTYDRKGGALSNVKVKVSQAAN